MTGSRSEVLTGLGLGYDSGRMRDINWMSSAEVTER
jgi:hypothetical protein